ncbi:MAG: hypothetical protein ABS81_11990 [Pseudonocardia sp. SCN 72-86]|nr:MAG: hypothetical protein ABS81_11990 [Pseudonocardia sp. SCN 72-86]
MIAVTGRPASAPQDEPEDAAASGTGAVPGPTHGPGPAEGDPDRPDGSAEAPAVAVGVETVVVHDRGRWAVEIVVVFTDGVVRRRVDTYPTRARAEISASLIRRAADRDL